jgi:hypothetical protein
VDYHRKIESYKILGILIVIVFAILSIIFMIRYKNEAKLELDSYEKGILMS